MNHALTTSLLLLLGSACAKAPARHHTDDREARTSDAANRPVGEPWEVALAEHPELSSEAEALARVFRASAYAWMILYDDCMRESEQRSTTLRLSWNLAIDRDTLHAELTDVGVAEGPRVTDAALACVRRVLPPTLDAPRVQPSSVTYAGPYAFQIPARYSPIEMPSGL